MTSKEYILRGVCPDALGLVAKVSNFLNENNLFIKESAHYGDPETEKFFMRIKVISPNKETAFGPLTRIIANADSPTGLAKATIVSNTDIMSVTFKKFQPRSRLGF